MEYPSNAFTVMDFDEEFMDDEHIGKLICFDAAENSANDIDGSQESSCASLPSLPTITGNNS